MSVVCKHNLLSGAYALKITCDGWLLGQEVLRISPIVNYTFDGVITIFLVYNKCNVWHRWPDWSNISISNFLDSWMTTKFLFSPKLSFSTMLQHNFKIPCGIITRESRSLLKKLLSWTCLLLNIDQQVYHQYYQLLK